jgi:hypothetical protein
MRRGLEDVALKDWPALDRIGARIKGATADKADILVAQLLENKAASTDFYRDYVCFDLTEDDAKFEAWYLLYDYCHLRGYGELVDLRGRDAVDEILADFDLEGRYENLFPMGKTFELHFPIQPRKKRYTWFWKKPTPPYILRLQIDTSDIYRLCGDLTDFTIQGKSQAIRFNERGISFEQPVKKPDSSANEDIIAVLDNFEQRLKKRDSRRRGKN